MPVDRFQPARGPREEVERGHEHQREAVVQAPHPRPDQPHVVVEREPAHEHVARRRPERHGHGLQRGDHVAVAEHHALGAAGAAGGVLEERGGGLVEGRALPQPAGLVEPGHVEHRIEPRDLRGEQPRDPEGGAEGDEGPGPGVREDPRVAPHVVFELARTRGRVDRHRDRPGHLHREEGGDVVEAGGQHQRRGLARRESPVGEAGREVLGALHQRGERDPRGLALRRIGRSVQLDVDAVAVAVRVEIDRFEQRRDAGGDRVRRLHGFHRLRRFHRFRSRRGMAGRRGTVERFGMAGRPGAVGGPGTACRLEIACRLGAGMGRLAPVARRDVAGRSGAGVRPGAVNRPVRPGRPRRPPAALAGP